MTAEPINETLPAVPELTPATRNRRARGQYAKKAEQATELVVKKLPEYIEAHEVNTLLRAAPNPRARLLMIIEWRAGLRVSEALALKVGDLSLDVELPTLRVRQGKGRKARIVPVHPELHSALSSALQFGNIDTEDKIVKASRSTADRWIREATASAQRDGAIAPGRKISNHTLRHSYARHLLTSGIPINYLSRWLGHSSIQTTLIYLELVPDPTGSLAMVP